MIVSPKERASTVASLNKLYSPPDWGKVECVTKKYIISKSFAFVARQYSMV